MNLNIIDAIENPKLFRPLFKDPRTWWSWFVLLKTLFALDMTRQEKKLYRKCTGRRKPPVKPFKELWAIIARRGGKSFMASIVAVFLALFFDFKKYLSPGERGVIQIVASDKAQARVIFKYISAILNSSPVFSQHIINETQVLIELSTGIDIEVMACSFRSIRGRTVVCAIFDEIAFWRVEGVTPDREILNAVRPSMATIPTSLLLVLSSPYARKGVLYDTHKTYFGKHDPDVLVWQAETRLMNPTISKSLIDRESKKDPVAAASEWGAKFRSDIESYVRREALEAVIVKGRYELPFTTGITYRAFCDPSGGSKDSMTLAISHSEGRRQIVDLIKEAKPPFSPDAVCRDFAQTLKSYGLTTVTGDRYAGQWPTERFKVHGIRYEPSKKPKSAIYQDFLPLINSNRVELLDNDRMFQQILNLERRTSRSGKDSIDHSPGGHDDISNVVAGCVTLPKRRGSLFRLRILGGNGQLLHDTAAPTAAKAKPQEVNVVETIDGTGKVISTEVYKKPKHVWLPGIR